MTLCCRKGEGQREYIEPYVISPMLGATYETDVIVSQKRKVRLREVKTLAESDIY